MKKLFWMASLLLLSLVTSAGDDEITNDSKKDESVEVTAPITAITDQERTRVSTDLAIAFSAFVEHEMEYQQIPGVAVAVVQDDKTTLTKGFGWRDVEGRLPVTTKTLFHIGSTTKSMTAMAIASLVDDGILDWDTPVVDIYPAFKLAEATNTVTFRHLLSMRGGIPDLAEDNFDSDNGTAEDLMRYVADIELLAEPGGAFSYSNISSSLSGYVGAIANGGDANSLNDAFIKLLQNRVLDPIGMQNAAVRYSDVQQNPNYGKSYILDQGEIIEADRQDFDNDPLAPSGILKADISEMALYVSTQLNRGLAQNGTQVVSENNMEAMWQPYLEGYAMGWEVTTVQGVNSVSHEGSFDNYLSVIGFVPELDFGYVILTNSADAGESLIMKGPDFLINYFLDKQ